MLQCVCAGVYAWVRVHAATPLRSHTAQSPTVNIPPTPMGATHCPLVCTCACTTLALTFRRDLLRRRRRGPLAGLRQPPAAERRVVCRVYRLHDGRVHEPHRRAAVCACVVCVRLAVWSGVRVRRWCLLTRR